jgi:hypothetical protein
VIATLHGAERGGRRGVKVAVHELDLLVDTDCGEHTAGQRVEETLSYFTVIATGDQR